MAFRFVDVVLAFGIVACLGLNWVLQPDRTQPGLEFLPEMVRSPAYRTLSANPHFSNGKTLQAPVEGTIARGHQPFHFEATPEDALRAGRTLTNPLTEDSEAVRKGQTVFRNFCTPCHGSAGLGDGTVVLRGVPAPPSLLAQQARDLPDGRMFHILTHGQGNMPPYSAQISQEEKWQVILYVRSLQQSEQQGQ